jgi:hypothetical protein
MRRTTPPSRPYAATRSGCARALTPTPTSTRPARTRKLAETKPNNTEVGLDRPLSFRNDLQVSDCRADGSSSRGHRRGDGVPAGGERGVWAPLLYAHRMVLSPRAGYRIAKKTGRAVNRTIKQTKTAISILLPPVFGYGSRLSKTGLLTYDTRAGGPRFIRARWVVEGWG